MVSAICDVESYRCPSFGGRIGLKVSLMKTAFVAFIVVAAAASQAVTFSNFVVGSAPLSTGWSQNSIGNSVSFFFPNAIVGDNQTLTSGTVNIQYDAASGPAMIANQAVVNLGAFFAGTGTVLFTELIIELDANGNEVGGNIGSISHVFAPNSNPVWSGTINFSRQVTNFRAKKSFTLLAPDVANQLDLAAIGIVNQNVQVVPEPATMTALGLGIAALLRRKRSSK